DQRGRRALHHSDDGEVEEEPGEGEEDVDDAHEELVDPAAEVAREGAERDAEDGARADDDDADLEGDAGAVEHLGEEVGAVLVGAEWVRRRRAEEPRVEVAVGRGVGRERRAEERDEEEAREQRGAEPGGGRQVLHDLRIRGSATPYARSVTTFTATTM